MAERKFALGGRGKGPPVPCGPNARVVAHGTGGDRFTVTGVIGTGDRMDPITYVGDGEHTGFGWSMIEIEYLGPSRPIFFVEND